MQNQHTVWCTFTISDSCNTCPFCRVKSMVRNALNCWLFHCQGYYDIDFPASLTISLLVCPFQKRILDGSLGFAAGVSKASFELNHILTHTLLWGDWLLNVPLQQGKFSPHREKLWHVQLPCCFIKNLRGSVPLQVSPCNWKYIPLTALCHSSNYDV